MVWCWISSDRVLSHIIFSMSVTLGQFDLMVMLVFRLNSLLCFSVESCLQQYFIDCCVLCLGLSDGNCSVGFGEQISCNICCLPLSSCSGRKDGRRDSMRIVPSVSFSIYLCIIDIQCIENQSVDLLLLHNNRRTSEGPQSFDCSSSSMIWSVIFIVKTCDDWFCEIYRITSPPGSCSWQHRDLNYVYSVP